MATKQIELEKAARGEGCLGKAGDQEPIFILRAQDMLSPVLVDVWASLAEIHGCAPEKVREARKLATQMRCWAIQKFPD